jgi:peroxiredoxin
MKQLLLLLSLAAVITVSAQEKPEGLFINSKAPEFALKDQYGATVTLKDLRKKGPTVLIFFRGSWCPYCSKALKTYQDSLGQLLTKGVQVIAITPEGKEGIDSVVAKTGAVFPILSDDGGKTMAAYQVAFKVDDRTVNRYKMAGIDLLKTNNQKEATLPVPAVYIINTEGTIVYRYFDENYRRRVSVKEILANIK